MSDYAVIVENDQSQWNDVTGESYHYPPRYRGILTPGCKFIYYKGRLRDPRFARDRLSPQPHYFGKGVIGKSKAEGSDWRCEILDYEPFVEPVLSKIGGKYFEPAPREKRLSYGYWQAGVREIDKKVYDAILGAAGVSSGGASVSKARGAGVEDGESEFESYNVVEGRKREFYSTRYERNPIYRRKAIAIHGLSCMVCDTNFGDSYGDHGEGFIHVHHNKPLSESGEMKINPKTDLSVLCPNCHAMVHRRKSRTLTVAEIKKMWRG